MNTFIGGRRELGQNLLIDQRVITSIVRALEPANEPIIEVGAGRGAITRRLAALNRPLTAIEIDPVHVAALQRTMPPHVNILQADVMQVRFPATPFTVVGNIPFHLTTSILRRLLATESWTEAVLLVQWEVARRRAGVGGATLLTAATWPWFDYRVVAKVPASAFRPRPSIDGGILHVRRRPQPLVDHADPYSRFVHQVFTGRGNGLQQILVRTGRFTQAGAQRWLREQDISPRALPRELSATQWASLWNASVPLGTTPRPRALRSKGLAPR